MFADTTREGQRLLLSLRAICFDVCIVCMYYMLFNHNMCYTINQQRWFLAGS